MANKTIGGLTAVSIGSLGSNAVVEVEDQDLASPKSRKLLLSEIGGGTAINGTDGYIPYRSDSVTFTDSPWYVISSSKLGFGSTSQFLYSVSASGILGIGLGALASRTTANDSVAVGDGALATLASNNYCVAVGKNALNLATGLKNIGIGSYAGDAVTTGTNNIFLGSNNGTKITTGGSNIQIGFDIDFPAGSTNNSIVIGDGASGKGSNTAVIGHSTVTEMWLGGQVKWAKGNGSPEGVVTAPIGSFYSNKTGGAGTSFYVKESGTGNTGWVAK